jgi:hypothetical protein
VCVMSKESTRLVLPRFFLMFHADLSAGLIVEIDWF